MSKKQNPQIRCLTELFEKQVDRTPEKDAIIDGTRRVSYGELERRANQLARHLKRLGVGPEVLVGICMERSAELVIGLLGILKSGGAYVPLDPAYPKERLGIIVEDARVRVMLTQEKELENLPHLHGMQVVCIDRAKDEIARESDRRLRRRADAGNLAYVIYTSGSTGRPKGVAIEHANTVTFITWAAKVFSREELRGVLASTSICFDISIFELFVPLSYGGTVIMVENALQLPSLHAADEVSLINTVPSAMAELVRMDAIPKFVRTVNLAGEPLKNALVQRVYRHETVEKVYNLYGPSEDTTYSTFALVPKGSTQAPTIGRPIVNSEAYILDEMLRPVPFGEAGQLFMGGAGLARGYLNRPDATAERFIPDPFSGRPGARLYMTGDLARYLANGEIDFLGRIDHQVKLRGFRVELGEIEVTLESHQGVREAVVVVREDIPDDKRLVAYVVPEEGAELVPRELRGSVKEKLPEYMVPSAIVIMESLPLTPNGKVNRRALPAPDRSGWDDGREYVAPRTPVEDVLVGMWSDVLHAERIGVLDNFFDLGGHSLFATRIISKIRTIFGVELPQRIFFESPTVEKLACSVESARHDGHHRRTPPLRQIARSSRQKLPLSFAQESLWFLDQLAPNSAAYNIPYKAELIGPLHVDALGRALNEIVRRHEPLRTTYLLDGGIPAQMIAPTAQLSMPLVDLQEIPPADRDIEMERMSREEAQKPFNLEKDLMVRAVLLRLESEKHVLLLIMHHIAGDDWTMGVLFRELVVLYEAFKAGRESPLPELAIRYSDYAAWQRLWLRGEVLEEQLSYWRRQLAGAPQVLELPMDRPRPSVQTFAGEVRTSTLTPLLSDSIKSLCRQEGVTLFMLLLAAFKILLHRYTGQTDIVVGSPIASRNQTEIEGLIGFFVNSICLRTDLSGDPGFRELLGRVREAALGAYSHQDVPIKQVVEEFQLRRELSRNPMVQIMFALQNPPPSHIKTGELMVSPKEFHNGTSKLDLTLFMGETQQGLIAMAEYNADLFDKETVDRMLGHLQMILEEIVISPERRISELLLLTNAEQQRLLLEWNDTQRAYPRDQCLHHLIETQVERTPDAVAVVFENQRLTYQELNDRANRIAHRLLVLGVVPENLVGLCMERSPDMVVGLLGILKAGAAYVPIDPDYPRERIDFILRDSRSSVLITKQYLLKSMPEHRAHVLCLDHDKEILTRCRPDNPAVPLCPQNLAYLIYTSGSTGVPKAVAIEHSSVVTFVHWVQDAFSRDEMAGVLASTSICFDLSVFELFATLCRGGKVILAENVLHLPNLSAAHEVTLINTVPSAMTELIRMDAVPATIRTVNLAGEALKNALVQQIYSRQSIDRVLNLYGPSEDTTYTTWAVMKRGATRNPPIGRPIANTRVYLLDPGGRPVPQGVPGELFIGGDGLARGYLGRADLTAEKFVPDPFRFFAGSRMYRTGDLARYLSDGNIEFLGRIDHQVKIRGFRIELGEIEAALVDHPAVREAIVIAHDDGSDAKRLVAYVTSKQAPSPASRELRLFLEQKLPLSMMPSAFIFLPVLPLTPNGKIDRRALPAPDWSRSGSTSAFEAPTTPTEEALSEIWQRVLGFDQVSIHDNFFELGGHSLMATQMISRIRTSLQMEMPLRQIFMTPTIAALAEYIESTRWLIHSASDPLASASTADCEEGSL